MMKIFVCQEKKHTEISRAIMQVISVKTKCGIVQVFNTAGSGANSDERVVFVRYMANQIGGSFNNFLKIID